MSILLRYRKEKSYKPQQRVDAQLSPIKTSQNQLLQQSTSSMSRRDNKMPLSSKKHIGAYLKRCLGWACIWSALASPVAAQQTPNNSCTVVKPDNGSSLQLLIYSSSITTWHLLHINGGRLQCLPHQHFIPSLTLPTGLIEDATCLNRSPSAAGAGAGTHIYLTTRNSNLNGGTYCQYKLTSDGSTWATIQDVINGTTVTTIPTSIPVLSPLGILASIVGMYWLGRRKLK